MTVPEILAAIAALHAQVDVDAHAVAAHHGARLQCRLGCASCCVDELTVWPVEALRIVVHAADVLASAPGPVGACAFLDAHGACRIYAVRPQVCRTQGLPLRYYYETEDDEIEEARDICPLNLEGPALALLDDDALWTVGLVEHQLLSLQSALDAHPDAVSALPLDDEGRVPLRALFGASPR